MPEIIQQYGRSLTLLAIISILFTLLYGAKNNIYNKISTGLKINEPVYSDSSEPVFKSAFSAKAPCFVPKTSLSAKKAYSISRLVEKPAAKTPKVTGGKALRLIRLYDGPSGTEELMDISESCIDSTGKTVTFPSRGLYLLMLSIRDDTPRNALQYLYIPIEGVFEP